jgi:hypothetical protein
VSAQVEAGSGRVIVDRIQTFDGTNPALEGITLGLGAPVPAEVWAFPDGLVAEGITQQMVVFNPSEDVAEVEVEVRLNDPATNGVPEPYELTIPPRRYSIVDLHAPDPGATEETPKRIPDGVAHTLIVRSLNHVPVVAERVFTKSNSRLSVGVSAVLGAPLAAPTWFVVGGGVSGERSEYLSVFNASPDHVVHYSVSRLAGGELVPIDDLQDLEISAGGRQAVRLSDHIDTDVEVLPLIVVADGPVVVERSLYRVNGRGIAFAMAIPLAEDVLVFDPIDG